MESVQDLMLVDPVDAPIEPQMGLLEVGQGQLILTIGNGSQTS